MALRATESDEDAPPIGSFLKNGFFVSSMDLVAWATSSTERLRSLTRDPLPGRVIDPQRGEGYRGP
jgi:hypothetical protein